MKAKIKVLVVDDSAVIRMLFTKLLGTDPGIEVVGSAPDPYVAREKLIALNPDVMTLDVEMPRMDGITFLEKVMAHMPTRTLVISSLTPANSATALRALEVGAVDVMQKPVLDVKETLPQMAAELVARVKAVAKANIYSLAAQRKIVSSAQVSRGSALARTTHQVLAIASSTGGTEALKVVLREMPSDLPGTVIVQHMPPGFTKAYADQLNKMCAFEVKEAEDGDRVMPGRVLIAPGNFHMELTRSGALYKVKLHQGPILHGVRPAADYLLKSVAKYAGSNAIGVVLTGMGRDGAEGLLEMKNAGACTMVQDEASCVVFGMPKAAIDLGASQMTLPIDQIARNILRHLQNAA